MALISETRCSIWPVVFLIETVGSNKPVGLIICSTTAPPQSSSSLSEGVAEVKIT